MNAVALTVIVVNWNTRALVGQCLESLYRQELGAPLEVIVVDNASDDGSADFIEARHPGVVLIRNAENVGFAKANNQALDIARGKYVLLLNSDTLLPDATVLSRWIDAMDRNPAAAASGCRLVFPDGTHQVGDAGYRPTFGAVFNYAFFLSRLLPSRRKGLVLADVDPSRDIVVDWVCGAAFLVKRDVVAAVGKLAESVFMFAEDIEWGCRITAAGYRVYYLPRIEIVHFQGASASRRTDREQFSVLWLENLRSLYRAYNGGQPPFLYDATMSAGFLLRAVLYAAKSVASRDASTRERCRRMLKYCRFSLGKIGKRSAGPDFPGWAGTAAS